MRMEAGLDTGPVAAMRALAIADDDTAGTLSDKLSGLGAGLLAETLPAIAGGRVALAPQDDAAATLAPMLTKADGHLAFDRPARVVSAHARGVDPWPGASALLDGAPLKLFAPRVVEPGRPVGAVGPRPPGRGAGPAAGRAGRRVRGRGDRVRRAAAPGAAAAAGGGGARRAPHPRGHGPRVTGRKGPPRGQGTARPRGTARPQGTAAAARDRPGVRTLSAARTAPLTARSLARAVLERVEIGGAYANRALSAALDRAPALAAEDRALATELVYGVLRRRGRIDRALQAFATQRARPAGRARADRAARGRLSDPVPRSRAGLRRRRRRGRRVQADRGPRRGGVRERAAAPARARRRAAAPRRRRRSGRLPGRRRRAARLAGGAAAGRAAGRRGARVRGQHRRRRAGHAARQHRPRRRATSWRRGWRPSGRARCSPRRRSRRTRSTRGGLDAPAATQAWRDGLFAITDAGAQIVAELCGAAAGERILDACAGNGGKTAHLLALAGDRARVDALDVNGDKLDMARATLQRLGLTGATLRIAAIWRSRSPIRRRAITASCSTPRAAGSACCAGTRRRSPGARRAISTCSPRSSCACCRSSRRRCCRAALLVYAVCTFDRRECEDVVAAFLRAHPRFATESAAAAGGRVPWARLTDAAGAVRTWPHRDGADGFFAVRLRLAPG